MFETIRSELRLSGRVGNNLENREEDVWEVRRRLHSAGHFDLGTPPEPHGYITRSMDAAIRSFQGAKGLRVDGILNPGGETETALRKIVVAGEDEFVPIPKRKPAHLDATGRSIRDEKPQEYKYLDLVPKSKTDLFKGSRAQEWEDWNALLERDKGLGSAHRKAFSEIYAFEGGMRSPTGGSACGGIVQKTLNDLKNEGFLPELASGKEKVKTSDLTQSQILTVYKAFFNDKFKGAAITAKLAPDKGYTLLDTIGDDEVAAVFADTLFRNNAGAVIEAINKTLSTNMVNDFTAGTQKFNNLRTIAEDPKKKRDFLNTLGEIRDEEFSDPGDINRHEYYRFRN